MEAVLLRKILKLVEAWFVVCHWGTMLLSCSMVCSG